MRCMFFFYYRNLVLSTEPLNLFTVANLYFVINSIDKSDFLVSLPHQHSMTVSLESYPLIHLLF